METGEFTNTFGYKDYKRDVAIRSMMVHSCKQNISVNGVKCFYTR